MIAPERWYEYQKNYQKYGFDMKPQPEPEQRKSVQELYVRLQCLSVRKRKQHYLWFLQQVSL